MGKPFDVSKFRKEITKSIDGLSIGFNDPTDWISTGNYALNYLISGDFNRGIPLGKVTVFAGDSGAGKSYICSGNIVKHAQEQGIFVVLIDSENALDEDWLKALGVDTGPDKLLKLSMAMIDDVAKTISTFMSDYKALPDGERPKVMFVIDSLGMLLTPTDVNQFDADDKISGGQGFIYASSIVVAMKKMKLKEDEDGNKVSEVNGIRAGCKVMKTRYAKPFEGVQVKIPYTTGMSPYSGLTDLIEKKGLLKKEGNSLVFTTSAGEIIKKFRKGWERNDDSCLDVVMKDFGNQKAEVTTVEEDAE